MQINRLFEIVYILFNKKKKNKSITISFANILNRSNNQTIQKKVQAKERFLLPNNSIITLFII